MYQQRDMNLQYAPQASMAQCPYKQLFEIENAQKPGQAELAAPPVTACDASCGCGCNAKTARGRGQGS